MEYVILVVITEIKAVSLGEMAMNGVTQAVITTARSLLYDLLSLAISKYL